MATAGETNDIMLSQVVQEGHLVAEWSKHPCLFNFKSPEYSNRLIKQQALADIGKSIDMTIEQVKCRLKNLRTQYTKAKKPPASGSARKTGKKNTWLLDNLKFLEPFIGSRTTTSSLPQLNNLDTLSVIHVSGTKGKGSTCAYCESILRHYGYKTGFFSSPHLVEVRERIRINGEPIAKEDFSAYFWEVYESLAASKEQHNGTMPPYFRFLTIMAFHVFLKLKVDVAIIEVGIGGQYDCTNIIRNPVVCGVTSLGLDHTGLLGEDIESIAWQKGGIFKIGVPAITSPQPEEALEVLLQRSKEIQCPLYTIPPLDDDVKLGVAGSVQKINASLAIQLSRIWLHNHGKGLSRCFWPGRNQMLQCQDVTYYIDGAHTIESIQQCVEWFQTASASEESKLKGKVIKILLFNITGDRNTRVLLSKLTTCGFDAAVFCPNVAYPSSAYPSSTSADQVNWTVSSESQMTKCYENCDTWVDLLNKDNSTDASKVLCNHTKSIQSTFKMKEVSNIPEIDENKVILNSSATSSDNQSDLASSPVLKSVSQSENLSDSGISDCDSSNCSSQSNSFMQTKDVPSHVFSSIYQALDWSTQGKDKLIPSCTTDTPLPEMPTSIPDADHIQILVSGSLHLVGGVLRVLNVDLRSSKGTKCGLESMSSTL